TSTRSRFEYVSGELLNVVTAIDDEVTVQDSPVPSKTFWESLSSSRSVVPVPPLIVRLTEGHEVAQEPELGVVTGVLEIVSLPPFPSIKSSWRLSVPPCRPEKPIRLLPPLSWKRIFSMLL